MCRQVLISHSDATRTSLHTWKTTRPLFAEFTETYCSRTYGPRRYDLARLDSDCGDYVPIGAQTGPSMILIDENGAELWLNGCTSGYMGEGVSGTGYILRAENFLPAHIDLVPYADHLHLRKGEADPLSFVERSEKVSYDRTLSRHLEQLDRSGYFKDLKGL